MRESISFLTAPVARTFKTDRRDSTKTIYKCVLVRDARRDETA